MKCMQQPCVIVDKVSYLECWGRRRVANVLPLGFLSLYRALHTALAPASELILGVVDFYSTTRRPVFPLPPLSKMLPVCCKFLFAIGMVFLWLKY